MPKTWDIFYYSFLWILTFNKSIYNCWNYPKNPSKSDYSPLSQLLSPSFTPLLYLSWPLRYYTYFHFFVLNCMFHKGARMIHWKQIRSYQIIPIQIPMPFSLLLEYNSSTSHNLRDYAIRQLPMSLTFSPSMFFLSLSSDFRDMTLTGIPWRQFFPDSGPLHMSPHPDVPFTHTMVWLAASFHLVICQNIISTGAVPQWPYLK